MEVASSRHVALRWCYAETRDLYAGDAKDLYAEDLYTVGYLVLARRRIRWSAKTRAPSHKFIEMWYC